MPLFVNQKVINESLYFHFSIYRIFTVIVLKIILRIASEIIWLELQEAVPTYTSYFFQVYSLLLVSLFNLILSFLHSILGEADRMNTFC